MKNMEKLMVGFSLRIAINGNFMKVGAKVANFDTVQFWKL